MALSLNKIVLRRIVPRNKTTGAATSSRRFLGSVSKEHPHHYQGHKNRKLEAVRVCDSRDGVIHACQVTIKEPMKLELGGELPEVKIHFEEWGEKDAPVVMIFPALSASSHVTSSVSDPTSGWWNETVGPGKGIDTNKFRVICASILGSPFGSTSPLSINPQTGKKYGRDFPAISPADQARVHKLLLDSLGISKVHAVVGSSLGGMQVFKFAVLFPEMLDRAISIVATGKTTPGTVAFRRVQRAAIMADPEYKDGNYTGAGPVSGMKVARELGTITYRSRDEFNERFEWNAFPPYSPQHLCYEVETYLAHQASKFVNKYDANCYLLLSRCMDLMDLGFGFENYFEGVQRITAKTYIIGVDRDLLIPLEEQQHLYNLLAALKRPVKFDVLSSTYGHDAFLKEHDWLNPRLRKFLESENPIKEHP